MAGDWIKMRVNLTSHPKVLRIAECLLENADYIKWSALSFGLHGYPPPSKQQERSERHAALRVTRYVTVTALLRFWGYANEHAKGEKIAGVLHEDIDEVTGVPGFAESLEAAGWADFDAESGGVALPEFEKHNTSFQSRSSAAAERQKRYRDRLKCDQSVTPKSDVTRDVTVTPREEKRREEKKETTTANAVVRKPRGSRLPEGWEPSEDGRAYASSRGLNPQDELDAFRDHWTAESRATASKLDWSAAWRTWCRNAVKFKRPSERNVGVTTPAAETVAQYQTRMAAERAASREGITKPPPAALALAGKLRMQ